MLVPSVVIMKPMSDLCWQCHQNSTALLRAANRPEEQKSTTIREAQEHLHVVQLERSCYKTTCDECCATVTSHFTTDGQFSPPSQLSAVVPVPVSSIKVHYSFDYAQQVHYPSDPLQAGPIYFLTRKCTIFRVNGEAIPRQINILTDEAGDCGKGANAVISRLHYFLDHYSLGEQEVYLTADNCTGQNKNDTMIQYLLWRTLTDWHTDITLFPCGRPHQVLTQLVFWALQENKGRKLKGCSRGGKQISWVQLHSVGFTWRWHYNCSNIRLDKLLCTTQESSQESRRSTTLGCHLLKQASFSSRNTLTLLK